MIKNPPAPPVSQGKAAKASNGTPEEIAKAFDGDYSTPWIGEEGGGWLEVDLGAPTLVHRALIHSPNWRQFKEIAIEYKDERKDTWERLYAGSVDGSWWTDRFVYGFRRSDVPIEKYLSPGQKNAGWMWTDTAVREFKHGVADFIKLDGEKWASFAPITARFFRLKIVEMAGKPIINEFQIIEPYGGAPAEQAPAPGQGSDLSKE